MDIEGKEPNALKGAINLLKNNSNMKLAVCVYHNLEDENKVRDIFKNINTTKTKIQEGGGQSKIVLMLMDMLYLYILKKD